ncbi:MAG: helix-turn-helix domain-containing protein [Actinomycetota bacterium]
MRVDLDEMITVDDIAERLGVSVATVRMWRNRTHTEFPEPFKRFGVTMVWRWGDVLRWAGQHGRIRTSTARANYQAAFGSSPAPPAKYPGSQDGTRPDFSKPVDADGAS